MSASTAREGTRHGIVIRTFADASGGSWFAVAEAVPEGIARAAVAAGELPGTAAELEARRRAAWPVETVMADSEEEAVVRAVRRLLVRGLEPLDTGGARAAEPTGSSRSTPQGGAS